MFQSTMEACGFVVARKSDYYSPLPSRRRIEVDDGAVDEAQSVLGVAYDLAGMKITLEGPCRPVSRGVYGAASL